MATSLCFKITAILILFIQPFLINPADCQFSLYLDQKETLRLLGLATEIYYVKDGRVENYPLTFVMPIPANVSELNFSWENRASVEIPYRILVNVTSNHNALLEPRLSISSSGVVPHRKEVWRVELPCSGEVSAEVDVTIVVHASTRFLAASPHLVSAGALSPNGRRRHHRQTPLTSSESVIARVGDRQQQPMGPAGAAGSPLGTVDGGPPDIVVPLKRRKVCVQGARDLPPSSGQQHRFRPPTGMTNRNTPLSSHHRQPSSSTGSGPPSAYGTPQDGGQQRTSLLLNDVLSDTGSVVAVSNKDDPPLLASPSDVFFIVTGSVVGAIFVTIALGLAVYWTRRKYAYTGSPPGSSIGAGTALAPAANNRECVMVSTFVSSGQHPSIVSKVQHPPPSSMTSSSPSPGQILIMPGAGTDGLPGSTVAGTEINVLTPTSSPLMAVQAGNVCNSGVLVPSIVNSNNNNNNNMVALGPRSAGATSSSSGGGSSAISGGLFGAVELGTSQSPTMLLVGTGGSVSPATEDLWDRVAELRLDGSRLLIRRNEEEGNAGKVFTGILMGSVSEPQEVTIKSFKVTAGKPYCKILLEEGLLTKGLAHPNLMSLLGVIGGRPYDRVPPSLVYPYAGANLKRYLQRCRINKMTTLNTNHVVHMGIQVANAVAYLHRQGAVHGDVAARNCAIEARSLTVKLTDSCLSRDLFPGDYHVLPASATGLGPRQLASRVPVPVKWLPVEGHPSPAGDVWSWGVFIWELVTLAADPFPEISPLEYFAFLRSGYRLGQPENCPDQLFTFMTQCWLEAPERRPAPHALSACLQDLQMQLQNFI